MDRAITSAVTRRFLAAACLVGMLAGCATAPQQGAQGPLEVPGAPQAVVVIPVQTAIEVQLGNARLDPATGAVLGALDGLRLLQLWPLLPFAAAAFVGLAVSGVTIGGAAGYAASIPPERQAEFVERASRLAVAELRLPDETAQALARSVATFTPYRAEVRGEAESKSQSGAALRAQGFGAAIEVKVAKVGFTEPLGDDHAIALYLAAEARLSDTATGKSVATRGLFYESPRHAMAAWEKDGAALVLLERARAQQTIAERIAEIFLLNAEAATGAGRARTPAACGVVPVRPLADSAADPLAVPRQRPAPVDSLNPSLAWQLGAAHEFLKPPLQWTHARDRRYDLRIWNEIDGAPGALVYERLGLDATEHRVESELAPRTTHYWSVRARYTIDGHPRATRWSAASTPRFGLAPQFRSSLFDTHVERDVAKTTRCGDADLNPCGCLDFVPVANYATFRTP